MISEWMRVWKLNSKFIYYCFGIWFKSVGVVCRNGGCDEEGGEAGRWAECGGEELVLCWIQKCGGVTESFMEDLVIDRAERGVKREWVEC